MNFGSKISARKPKACLLRFAFLKVFPLAKKRDFFAPKRNQKQSARGVMLMTDRKTNRECGSFSSKNIKTPPEHQNLSDLCKLCMGVQGPRNTGARVGYSPPLFSRLCLFLYACVFVLILVETSEINTTSKPRKSTLTLTLTLTQRSSVIVRWSELDRTQVKISQ